MIHKRRNFYKLEIIFSGFGGQGILFAGNLFALAGVKAGFQVTYLPVYGPEMRGGTCNCTTIISSSEIASPVVKQPDTLVLMNLPSFRKFSHQLKKGGYAFLNSDLIPETDIQKAETNLSRRRIIKVPMNSLAEALGCPQLANLVGVGALWAYLTPFDKSYLVGALKETLKFGKEHLLEPNLKAFEAGINYIESIKKS